MSERCDVLILGSGLAGLSLALSAARFADVLVLTKKGDSDSNTNYAQGGIAAVMGRGDSFAAHERDTLRCGAGLCDRDV
ncbi:MAG: FAD-binding protein, partial [Candidatus Eisenbacteria bacterium]|nr:FAD-binding protein [Candidatus Eisenbacteria bacterium]